MWGNEPKISTLLQNRFMIATFRCFQMEFQLLGILLLYVRSDLGNPLTYLMDIARWLMWSWYTWCHMAGLVLNAATYGLLLYHKHQQMPIRCSQWREFVQRELLFKLSVLITLLGIGFHSSCFYIGYVDRLGLEIDMSNTRRFLVISCIFCSAYYFVAEHMRLSNVIWTPPLIQKRMRIFNGLIKWQQVQQVLGKNIKPSLLIALLYWPNMGTNWKASWQLFGQFWCLTTLITAQLHQIKKIYGNVMQSRLPMTVLKELKYQLYEQQVPLTLALETTSLHGFQVQVAKNFYDLMTSDRSEECRNIFQLSGFTRQHAKDWHLVRDIILGRISAFTQKLDQCLAPKEPQQPEHKKQTFYLHPHMRLLMKETPRSTRIWSRRAANCEPRIQQPALPRTGMKWLQHLCNEKLIKLEDYFRKFLIAAVEHYCAQDNLLFEISCAESLLWLIPGFAQICVRSLEVDKCGVIHGDLERIFYVLLDLEKTLCLAKQKNSDVRVVQLWNITSRSINKMVYYFQDCLEFIISNENLHQKLQQLVGWIAY